MSPVYNRRVSETALLPQLRDARTALAPAARGLVALVVTGEWEPDPPAVLWLVVDDGRSTARLTPLPSGDGDHRGAWQARFTLPAAVGAAARTAYALATDAGGSWDLPRPQRGV